jgi:predicted transcriptional regulator
MQELGRVVTAKLPDDLVAELDSVAERIERSKSWIIRHALRDWLADEQRRHEMTLEGLKDIDESRVLSHDELKEWAEDLKRGRRAKSAA